MLKLLLLLFLACIANLDVGATNKIKKAGNETSIRFIEADWNKALQTAKDAKKLVFIDIYATWCGPCRMLKKNTFTDKNVAQFFNDNFINVSIDGEKGVGPDLLERYQVEAYPTLIIADENGDPVLYTMGYLDPKTLLEFAKAALKKKM